jgi:lactate dehydrogenase-like 2-hydroxyacid dehydrogenase
VPDVGYAYHDNLLGLARSVDVLIVIAPATPDTKHAINAEVLAALGATGTLINVARGSLVDERALVAALQNGTIAAAGLDVFEVEPCLPEALIAMDNVVLLPHVGSASVHTRNLMGQLQLDNLTGWLDHRRPKTPVSETPWHG